MSRYLHRILFFVASLWAAVFIFSATPVFAAPDCDPRFLTFPAWYHGLTEGADCHIKSPGTDITGFLLKIILNVVEIGLQLVAYIALGYLIYGGFKYITSAGYSDRVESARKIIQNAIVGLVISFFSIAAINLITGSFIK